MATVSFNPSLTTAPQNTFVAQTQGFVQGDFVDDPSSRMYLNSGLIAAAVTQPVWGGLAIQELVPATGEGALGSSLALATNDATTTGFSVFTQGYNMVIVPGNSVQTTSGGGTIPYFRLGSGARIRVKCSASLAAAVDGGQVGQNVSWDFTNDELIPYDGINALNVKILSVNANSKVVAYNSGTGAVTWTTGPAATILL
ncbi:MAG: hypothetical protein B7X04_04315 [Parcubacteria group bacterium 21-54-25]|nr:MAG: hypothetical protein B7X04_04315 [Parcubacteria group bacterium 21-54-25]